MQAFRLALVVALMLTALAACGPAEDGSRGGSSQGSQKTTGASGEGPAPTFAAVPTAGGLLVTVTLRRDPQRPLARIRLMDTAGAELGVDESVATAPDGRPLCATFELDRQVDGVVAEMTDSAGLSWSRPWTIR